MTTNSDKARETASAGGNTPQSPNRRILVVDDEKTIRHLFLQIISYGLPDCRIDMAVNGAEAVEMFRQGHHQVVLMDLKMPVMDGQQAFQEIQNICNAENLKMPAVIFCTGYAPPSLIENIIQENPTHCLLKKPCTNQQLMDTIKSRLAM